MNLSNFQILNAIEPLNKLSQAQLPIKVSFPLIRNIKKLEELLPLINSEKEKIVKKFAITNEKGEYIKEVDDSGKEIPDSIKLTNTQACLSELDELFSVPNIVDITLLKITDIPDVIFDVRQLSKIDWMFE